MKRCLVKKIDSVSVPSCRQCPPLGTLSPCRLEALDNGLLSSAPPRSCPPGAESRQQFKLAISSKSTICRHNFTFNSIRTTFRSLSSSNLMLSFWSSDMRSLVAMKRKSLSDDVIYEWQSLTQIAHIITH